MTMTLPSNQPQLQVDSKFCHIISRLMFLSDHVWSLTFISMTIGGVNSTLFTGQINYLNVESLVEGLPFWAVQLDQINVDGKSSNIVSSIVIVDTGASLIYLSDESLRAVFAQIPGSRFIGNENEWILPCEYADRSLGLSYSHP